jgi:hypothetical protein
VEDHVLRELCQERWFGVFAGMLLSAIAHRASPRSFDAAVMEKLSIVLQKLSKTKFGQSPLI